MGEMERNAALVLTNCFSFPRREQNIRKVTVHPHWQQFDPTQFRYDMMLFADVSVNGHALGTNDNRCGSHDFGL